MSKSIYDALLSIKGGDTSEVSQQNEISKFATATKLLPEQDMLAGKRFFYKGQSPTGRIFEDVEHTIESNGKYFVMCRSGMQMSVDDLVANMVENSEYSKNVKRTDGLLFEDEDDIDSIRPSRLTGNGNQMENIKYEDLKFDEPLKLNDEYSNVIENHRPSNNQQIKQNSPDPVIILLEKAKKFENEITINFKLQMPDKNIFKMVLDNFENAETSIIDFLLSGENIKEFRDQLKIELLKFIKEDDNGK